MPTTRRLDVWWPLPVLLSITPACSPPGPARPRPTTAAPASAAPESATTRTSPDPTTSAPIAEPIVPCSVSDCEPPPGDARSLATAAFAIVRDDPARSACLSAKAAVAAEREGNAAVAGSARYNEGLAWERLGCPDQEIEAYRASICKRPVGSAAAVVRRHCGPSCERPCEPGRRSGRSPGLWGADALGVAPGSTVADTRVEDLFPEGGARETERIPLRIEGTEVVAVAVEMDNVGEPRGIVLLRRQGDLWGVLNVFGVFSGGTFPTSLSISERGVRPDGRGSLHVKTNSCMAEGTLFEMACLDREFEIRFDARHAWLVDVPTE